MKPIIKTLQTLAVLILLAPGVAVAQKAGDVISVIGTPQKKASGAQQWSPLLLNDAVSVGDRIRTSSAKVKLLLVDDTVLTLDQNTDLKLSSHMFKPKEKQRSGLFDLFSGRIKTLVGHFFGQSDIRVNTPTAVAGVRGTHFIVEIVGEGDAAETRVVVFDGEVDLSNASGNVDLTAGMMAGMGLNGLLSPARQLSQQELRGLERGLEVRSKAAAKERAKEMVQNFSAAAEDFSSSGNAGSSALGGLGTGLAEAAAEAEQNTLPPVDIESFEPSRGRGTFKITWPKEN